MLSPLPENVLPSGSDTLLSITTLGGFQYQARGLTQGLAPINQLKQQLRTINGALVDVSNHAFRKYSSDITCTDVNAPPLDNLWPGMTVTVGCAAVLCYRTGNPGSPARSEVSGSSYVRGSYTFYRPVLTMMIMDLSESFEEWKSDFQWKMTLEEI